MVKNAKVSTLISKNKRLTKSSFPVNEQNVIPLWHFQAIHSIVWRALRMPWLAFKFSAGVPIKVPDVSLHSARCTLISKKKRFTFHWSLSCLKYGQERNLKLFLSSSLPSVGMLWLSKCFFGICYSYHVQPFIESSDENKPPKLPSLPSLPCFSVQIQHKICKNMNSVQQQSEHHHWKVLIKNFHLSGHTFIFRWIVQDLEVSRFRPCLYGEKSARDPGAPSPHPPSPSPSEPNLPRVYMENVSRVMMSCPSQRTEISACACLVKFASSSES